MSISGNQEDVDQESTDIIGTRQYQLGRDVYIDRLLCLMLELEIRCTRYFVYWVYILGLPRLNCKNQVVNFQLKSAKLELERASLSFSFYRKRTSTTEPLFNYYEYNNYCLFSLPANSLIYCDPSSCPQATPAVTITIKLRAPLEPSMK